MYIWMRFRAKDVEKGMGGVVWGGVGWEVGVVIPFKGIIYNCLVFGFVFN